MTPRVTVILPVYNGAKYLRQAIDSILHQSYRDFELLLIDDGSTDDSWQIISSYNDSRIIAWQQSNRGLAATLNCGLDAARGEYVARMDQDDISRSDRLAEQVAFMDQHSDIGICGAWAKIINEDGFFIRKAVYVLSHKQIAASLLFNSPLCHPTVMFRRSVLEDCNLRYNNIKIEDIDLWLRAIKFIKFANLPKFLLQYRFGVGLTSKIYKEECDRCFEMIFRQQALNLALDATDNELRIHQLISDFNYCPDKFFLLESYRWLNKLAAANRQILFYDQDALNLILARTWFAVLRRVYWRDLLQWPKLWWLTIRLVGRLGFFGWCSLARLLIKLEV